MTLTENETYVKIWKNIDRYSSIEKDEIANIANVLGIIKLYMEEINWVGFYTMKGSDLVISSYQGKPNRTRLGIDEHLCSIASRDKIIKISYESKEEYWYQDDMDSETGSEIAIPIIIKANTYGVLNIKSCKVKRFNQQDALEFEEVQKKICKIIDNKLDIDELLKSFKSNKKF